MSLESRLDTPSSVGFLKVPTSVRVKDTESIINDKWSLKSYGYSPQEDIRPCFLIWGSVLMSNHDAETG